jgi:hypothetical protein
VKRTETGGDRRSRGEPGGARGAEGSRRSDERPDRMTQTETNR